MALLCAYTLHDVKALSYSPPFFCSNDAIAKRMLLDLVSDTNTMPGRHPADFKLYKIGTFDEHNAALQPLPIPEHVIDAVALAQPIERQLSFEAIQREFFRRAEESRKNGEAAQ